MSEQILLQGKILGIEEFLLSRPEELLMGRSQWITLLSEVLPRALLAELGLARILLGSSGGGQFLLVLPGEARAPAEELLRAAAGHACELSNGIAKLVWSVTENLGDWTVVRRRLNDELHRRRGTSLAETGSQAFQPFSPAAPSDDAYFSRELAKVCQASSVGWSPEAPAAVIAGSGKHTWSLTPNLSLEGITLARHTAPSDDDQGFAGSSVLARRSQGRRTWGVLRGDVDSFGVRLRRVQSIEEHVQLSVLYKQFFAGELEVVCSLPEFWRKVTIIYSGGDDFSVYGCWDALIPLARELQRLFHRFTEENLKEFPGAEGKTISMALAITPEPHYSLARLYWEAGRALELAKSSDKDCIYLLGRTLEWKQLGDAAELKDTILRLMNEYQVGRPFLAELRGFYASQLPGGTAGDDQSFRTAWRFERRFNRVLRGARDRQLQKVRTHLINEIIGRDPKQAKLRPAGLVALEWASLGAED